MTWIYVLLCCLFNINYGRMVVQPTLNNEVLDVQVEKKHKENYYYFSSGWYTYGATDLCSWDFIKNITEYYVNQYGADFLSLDSTNTGQYIITIPNGVIDVSLFDSADGSHTKMFDVNNVILRKSATGVSFYYDFIFSNASPYDKQLTYRWLCHYQDSYSKVLYVYGLEVFCIGTTFNSAASGWFDVNENGNSNYAFLYTCVNNKTATYNEGYAVGYSEGENKGYIDGSEDGYEFGYADGYDVGYNAGQTFGYQQGFNDGQDSDATATTIFAGVLDVSMIPVNVFLLMFNYEVFGINIAGFITGLITIAMIIIIIRFVLGR